MTMMTDRHRMRTTSGQRTARGMLIAVVALCCICSALPAGAVDAAHLIRPGVGIGPVHLGGTLADAERAWGPPTERQPISGRNPTDDFTTYSWEHAKRLDVDGLAIDVLDSTGAIIRVSVTENRWFATAGGTVTSAGANWIGSTPAQVRREFGAPDPLDFSKEDFSGPCSVVLHYRRRGIHFSFPCNSTGPVSPMYVDSIIIVAPNSAFP
jgi:hypothetical protein